MKKLNKIIFISIFLVVPGIIGFSQAVSIKADTTTITQGVNSQGQKEKEQNQIQNKGSMAQHRENMNVNGNQAIKQVKGARPDMSKVRGARPPTIVRQSGSGIPRGIGKPGGAARRGGR